MCDLDSTLYLHCLFKSHDPQALILRFLPQGLRKSYYYAKKVRNASYWHQKIKETHSQIPRSAIVTTLSHDPKFVVVLSWCISHACFYVLLSLFSSPFAILAENGDQIIFLSSLSMFLRGRQFLQCDWTTPNGSLTSSVA